MIMMMIMMTTMTMVLDLLGLLLLHLMIFCCLILPYYHLWWCLTAKKLNERQPLENKLQLQKKVKFSENLNKLFSEVLNKNDEQKPMSNDTGFLSKPHEMIIPEVPVFKKSWIKGSYPKNWGFSLVEIVDLTNSGYTLQINLKRRWIKSIKLFYLMSDYARETLAKNKIKIHSDTENLYAAIPTWKRAYMIFYSRSKTKQKIS